MYCAEHVRTCAPSFLVLHGPALLRVTATLNTKKIMPARYGEVSSFFRLSETGEG